MRWDVVLERKTINKLNEDINRKTIRHIAKAAERNKSIGFIAKVGRVQEPVVTTDEVDQQEKYRYLVRLRFEDTKSRCRETSKEKFGHILKVVEKCARSREWTVVDGDTKDGPVATDTPLAAKVVEPRMEFHAPKLNQVVLKSLFGGIYERDSHIRLIHDSTETFVQSSRQRRSHTLLWGKPAGCKTTIFEAFKVWYEQGSTVERVAIIDATTLTKAGLERWVLDKASDGMLPEILCLEEVEKFQPENLLSLLSVMDGRGQLQRTNARDGHVRADARILVWGTCNDADLLKGFKNGALWSRFTHHYECLRPTRDLMYRILLREIGVIEGGKPEWAKAALDYGYDVMKTDDPRAIVGLLDGRDRLLTGEYQKDQNVALNQKR